MRRLLFDGTSGRGSTLLGLDEKGAVVVDSFTLGATRFCQIYWFFLLEVSKIGYQLDNRKKKLNCSHTHSPTPHKQDPLLLFPVVS